VDFELNCICMSWSSTLSISVCAWASCEELSALRFELEGAALWPPPPVDGLPGFFGDIEQLVGGGATEAQRCN
jgi:hypothetical protein